MVWNKIFYTDWKFLFNYTNTSRISVSTHAVLGYILPQMFWTKYPWCISQLMWCSGKNVIDMLNIWTCYKIWVKYWGISINLTHYAWHRVHYKSPSINGQRIYSLTQSSFTFHFCSKCVWYYACSFIFWTPQDTLPLFSSHAQYLLFYFFKYSSEVMFRYFVGF